jgi:TRAP-type C4-dicarboxylate transport system permease small subunit
MEHSKTILITFGMKNLKNNIMSKTQEIIRFIGVCCIALFGLAIISFGFSMLITPFLK